LVGYEGAYESVRPAADGDVSRAELLAQLDHVRFQLEQEAGAPGIMVAPRDRLASLYQSMLEELAKEGVGELRQAPGGAFEARFDSRDPCWAKALPGLLKQKFEKGRHPWIGDAGPVERLPNDCRVALLSDWGTGLYGAPACAEQILKAEKFDVLMHLGDVYYSGTDKEMKERFLDFWPGRNARLTRCLNGNHEMYSGGEAYFKMLPTFGQKASYCALQNDHWLLVGLDTAYTEHELYGGQVAWLGTLLAQSANRRVILLSHHQPFSSFDAPGHRLISQLAPMLEQALVFAWYWGHEHRCVIFERHDSWGIHARCVGHSGFPEFRHKSLGGLPSTATFVARQARGVLTPPALVLDGPNDYIPEHRTEYGPHGYVELRFEGRRLTEQYYSAGGTLLEEQMLGDE
jgi:hypothetical protein